MKKFKNKKVKWRKWRKKEKKKEKDRKRKESIIEAQIFKRCLKCLQIATILSRVSSNEPIVQLCPSREMLKFPALLCFTIQTWLIFFVRFFEWFHSVCRALLWGLVAFLYFHIFSFFFLCFVFFKFWYFVHLKKNYFGLFHVNAIKFTCTERKKRKKADYSYFYHWLFYDDHVFMFSSSFKHFLNKSTSALSSVSLVMWSLMNHIR